MLNQRLHDNGVERPQLVRHNQRPQALQKSGLGQRVRAELVKDRAKEHFPGDEEKSEINVEKNSFADQ